MNTMQKLNKNQNGQAALEAAIILIAFVVVASVFAFAVLSAGTASTEKGEQAIYAGLEGVQSSMEIKGAVIALGDGTTADTVGNVIFTAALVAGGEPINVDATLSYQGGRDQLPRQHAAVEQSRLRRRLHRGERRRRPAGRRRTRRDHG